MKDKFEKHVAKNRHHLDDIESLDVEMMWQKFEKATRPVKSFYYVRLTVAAIGIILIGSMIFLNQGQDKSMDQLVQERLALLDPSLVEEQVRMIHMIEHQNSILDEAGISEEQFPELFEELKIIDSLQMDLINDLELYNDKSNLIKILLKHYTQKTRILELMLNEIEKQESEIEYEKAKQI